MHTDLQVGSFTGFGRIGSGNIEGSLAGVNQTFSFFNPSSVIRWEMYSLNFVATDVLTTMAFSNHQNPALHFTGFDDVSVETAVPASVPEPATMILLGSGLIGLVGFNYKRDKKAV